MQFIADLMRKFFKILLYTIGSLLLLLLLVVVFLQTPPGKNIVRKQAVRFLNEKLKTPVEIRKIDYSLPNFIGIEGLVVVDVQKDTLLSLDALDLRINMLDLLRNKMTVNKLSLTGVYAHVYRNMPDTAFNYQFIIDAFASQEDTTVAPVAEEKSSKPVDLNVKRVALQEIHVRYEDQSGGLFFSVDLKDLLLRPQTIDLQQMAFAVKEFSVNGLQSHFATDTAYLPPTVNTDTGSADFKISVDQLQLADIGFAFDNLQDSSIHFDVLLEQLKAGVDSFDLAKEQVAVNTLQLSGVNSRLVIGKEKPGKTSLPDTAAETESNWMITAKNLMLKQVNFVMDNQNSTPQPQGIDYAHLDIQQFSLNAEKTYYTADSLSANLKHLALVERSGLSIIEMRTLLTYHNRGAALKNLFLQTPGTIIRDNLEISYASLESLQKELGKARLDIALRNSQVAVNDVLVFMPSDQRSLLLPYKGMQLKLAGTIKGPLADLRLQDFYLSGLKNTQLLLSGTLAGLPDADRLHYDLKIDQLQSSAQDVIPFMPQSVLEQVHIPGWFSVSGTVSGTLQDYYPQLTIKTADGDIRLDGSLLMSEGSGNESYDLVFATNALNVGKILRQDTLIGTITMNGTVKGKGFDVNTMQADMTADVHFLTLQQYDYRNISLAGNIDRQKANIRLNSRDQNAEMIAVADVDFNNPDPAIKGILDIRHLDLHALCLLEDTLQLSGKIAMDFPRLNPRYPEGTLFWENPKVNISTEFISLDSMVLRSEPTPDSSQNIAFNFSNILTGSLTGHIPLTEIAPAAMAHIDQFYNINDSIAPAPSQYDLALKTQVNYHPALRHFAADLNSFRYLTLTANMAPGQFVVEGFTPHIAYGENTLDSLNIQINERPDRMDYAVSASRFGSGEKIAFWKPSINGYLQQDSLTAALSVSDTTLEEQFAAGFSMRQKDSAVWLHLFPGLKFDYANWDVNPKNQIAFGSGGFFMNDFDIRKGGELIQINSAQPSVFQSPLNVKIQDFYLSNITAMVSKDTLLANGKLNLNGQVDLADTFPVVNASLTVDSLTILDRYFGDIAAIAGNDNANTYHARLDITENNNNFTLQGKYHIEPVNGNNFDFLVDIQPFSMASIEALAMNSIKNSAGYLRGQLSIKGTPDNPEIEGELHTDSLYTTVSLLNEPFYLPEETIAIKDGIIRFEDFDIFDKNNQKANLKGKITTPNYRDYFLNLLFSSDSIQVLNSTQKDNEQFYGKMFVSARVNIDGYATAPEVSGNLRIHDSTKAYFALLDQGRGIEETEGIVKFFNGKNETPDYYRIDSTTHTSAFVPNSGAKVNLNLDIDKYANFNVIIDPATGDNLSVSGEAALNADLMPDGNIGLTGVYALDAGYYQLNYALFKRKFEVQKGSTITLAGDPLDAMADITAAYNANIAPYELVEKQVSDPAQLVYYKQRLPFQVLLKIKGKVMSPEITFDIALPEDKLGLVSSDVANMVQSKLAYMRNSPSDMNKQAFAILTLGRFITDDPFSTMGGTTEYLVRQSAARMLSQQLNQIAGNLVKGLDLSMDLASDEDYSTGQKVNRTDLNITASKRLFNDRLTLTVGNDFQLEGQPVQDNKQSSFIPGTLSADYKLSADGRYTLRAYRSSQLQNIIDGYVTETGLGFRLTVEYNRLKQLFENRKKMREKWRKQRAEARKASEEQQETEKIKERTE